jgi:hypothetical protein
MAAAFGRNLNEGTRDIFSQKVMVRRMEELYLDLFRARRGAPSASGPEMSGSRDGE